MFRLFGGTSGGDGKGGTESSGLTPKTKLMDTGQSGSSNQKKEQQETRGGFFHLASGKETAGADSLFDDLEVKPPAATAASDSTDSSGKTGGISGASTLTRGGGGGGDALSAFHFMATAPAAISLTPPPHPAGSVASGRDVERANEEMSAFSFLSGAPPAADKYVGAGTPAEDGEKNAAPESSSVGASSFSFLSENAASPESSFLAHVTPKADPYPPANGVPPAAGEDHGELPMTEEADGAPRKDGTEASVESSFSLAAKPVSRASSSSSVGGSRSSVLSSLAVAEPAGEGIDGKASGALGAGIGAANPPRKPSTGVVRKKRTARRVGYARDGSIAAVAGTGDSSNPVASGGSSAMKIGAKEGGEESMPSPSSLPAASSIGAGISYVSQDGGARLPEVPPGSSAGQRKTIAEISMDDSVVAEAAAMAALAASMAPEHIHGAIAKGDLKQGSSHGAASSSSSNSAPSARLSHAALEAAEAAASVASTMGDGPPHGGGSSASGRPPDRKSGSFMRKGSPTSSRQRLTFMETPKGDTAASAGKATEISSREAGEVSYIQPVFHPTVDGLEYKREQSGERDEQPPAMEVGKEAKEETALEELRKGLSLLVNDFRDKSRSLSDRLAEAATDRAALQASRAFTSNAHAESIRRLAEVEAEQQRLADAEDFEKAAELSAEIESLKKGSEAAAERLGELDEKEAVLERDSSEDRKKLLRAVENATDALKVFQGRQDGKLGRLVSERAARFEAEYRRMNIEAERIALERMHVERDSAHLEEELAQTETAISMQTGGEDDHIAKFALMRMELEAEVKELEAQLQAKKDALREVVAGLVEAEARIDAVRSKFERQLLRLRERERLVAVSREDSRQEDDTLERDRARHQADKEKATREQQILQEAVAGVAEEVKLAALLQSTLANHWSSEEARVSGDSGGVDGDQGTGDDTKDATAKLSALRSEVEGARSRNEQGARGVAALEKKRDGLLAERAKNDESLPGLEQKKRVAVAAKNYKEAGQVSRQIKDTERRQQEVSGLLSELDESVAEGSGVRKELAAMKSELARSEEALKEAEEGVAASRIAVLEKRARPLRLACRAVKRRGSPDGLRDAAEALLVLQLSSLEAEAKDIAAPHGLNAPDLSLPQPDDSDDERDSSEVSPEAEGVSSCDRQKEEDEQSDGVGAVDVPDEDGEVEASTDPGHEVGNKEACLGNDDAIEEETLAIDGGGVLQEDTPASVAARELLEAETAEVERELAALDHRLAEALGAEDYDLAAELDEEMVQMRKRLADFAAEAGALGGGKIQGEPVDEGDEEQRAPETSGEEKEQDDDGEGHNPSALDPDLGDKEEGGAFATASGRVGSSAIVSEGASEGVADGGDGYSAVTTASAVGGEEALEVEGSQNGDDGVGHLTVGASSEVMCDR